LGGGVVKSPFPNKFSFDRRLEFHKSMSRLWGDLVLFGKQKVIKSIVQPEAYNWEQFIVRCTLRRARHLRDADSVRRRGYSK
jgi:hypothetical protein